MIALDISHLSYAYPKRKALTNISLQCDENQKIGILGPNGSGKSTLLRILSTLTATQSGTVKVFGYDIQRQCSQVRSVLGVVFQSQSLDSKLTVCQNLICYGTLHGMQGNKLQKRMDYLLEKLHIADRKNEHIETLSGGLQRRVELAKSLLHSPRLLLLDEPTAGLDPIARQEFWQFVKRLQDHEKTTVVFATHFLEEAEQCDSLTILHEGNIIATGSPRELKKEIGESIILIHTMHCDDLFAKIRGMYSFPMKIIDRSIRMEVDNGTSVAAKILTSYGSSIESISVNTANLGDVFFRKVGKNIS